MRRGYAAVLGPVTEAGRRREVTVRPERVRRADTRVVGIDALTTNQRESDPATAVIPVLWRRFHEEGFGRRLPQRAGSGTTCAVYTDYEGDRGGEYRYVVGAEVAAVDEVPPGMVAVTVPAGDYLVFAARGPMPDALVATWRRVWEYFEDGPLQRAFTADVEVHYPAGSAVDVCVAVRPGGGEPGS
jgi:predicted transcriptional regulator YdeE